MIFACKSVAIVLGVYYIIEACVVSSRLRKNKYIKKQ